jgi:hypothetical protein
MKGSGDLCRALVKRGAVLGTLNRNMLNVFNHPVATKQLLYRSVHPQKIVDRNKQLLISILSCEVCRRVTCFVCVATYRN